MKVGRGSRSPASANSVRRAQRGAQTRRLSGAYGGAPLDGPPPLRPPSSSTRLTSISAVSLVSPPIPPNPSQPAASSRLAEEQFLEEPRDAEASQWEAARRGDWHCGWEGRWEGERWSLAVNQSNVGPARERAGAREWDKSLSV